MLLSITANAPRRPFTALQQVFDWAREPIWSRWTILIWRKKNNANYNIAENQTEKHEERALQQFDNWNNYLEDPSITRKYYESTAVTAATQ